MGRPAAVGWQRDWTRVPASCKAECQRRLLFFLLSLAPLLALSTPGHDAEKAGGFETFEAHRLTKGNRISRSLIHRSPPLPLNRKKTALLITCCTSCGSLSILLFRNVGEKKLRSEREREREKENKNKVKRLCRGPVHPIRRIHHFYTRRCSGSTTSLFPAAIHFPK